MSAERVLIKKYENRRLYDTRASRYINLDDGAALVREGHEVEVVDVKSGEDLTRRVLAQIIFEETENRESGPPLDFLRELIRAGDQAQRDFLHWYLSTASEAYTRLDEAFKQARRGWSASHPGLDAWLKLWDPRSLNASLARFFARQSAAEGEEGAAPPAAAAPKRTARARSPRAELAELRQRIEELEARLERGED
jgi:polyhydroxyalkanoate synthesis repressor PhaR